MAEYGYLHLGRVLKRDVSSGGYYLESVGLARTSKWGPVPSCVPGLSKGDKVILAATGTSRDNLVIIAKMGAEFASIADIEGLLDALHAKADKVALDNLATWVAALETGAGDLDSRLTAAEATLGTLGTTVGGHTTELAALDTRVDALEDPLAYGSVWLMEGGNWECPGLPQASAERMPWASVRLSGHPTAVTIAPDRRSFIIGKSGLWEVNVNPRWTNVTRVGGGIPGQGTDRTFVLGATNRQWGPVNPRFETDLSDWTPFGHSAAAVSTLQAHSGLQSARITPTGAAAQAGISDGLTPAGPGQIVAANAWVWTTNATTNTVQISASWYNASSALISTSTALASSIAGQWSPVAGSWTSPAGTAFMQVTVSLIGTPAAAQVFYVDDVTIGPSMNDQVWNIESWCAANSGNQEYQQRSLGSGMALAAGDRVQLYCYWNGAATDRLNFPGGSNRISFSYRGRV